MISRLQKYAFRWDNYRPIFGCLNGTKENYNTHYNIENSDCYTKNGLLRTGCAGCPFGRDFECELEIVKEYETRLYAAVNKTFEIY